MSACSSFCEKMVCLCWRDQGFHGPEHKRLCLATASSSCLFKIFFCNPGSGDATRRSLIAPSLPSVSVRLCVSNAQALPLTGGGQRRSNISGRDDSACVSAPVLTEVRGTWTTPRQLIHATLSSQGRSTHTSVDFHQASAAKSHQGHICKKQKTNKKHFLGPIFQFFTCKILNAQPDL